MLPGYIFSHGIDERDPSSSVNSVETTTRPLVVVSMLYIIAILVLWWSVTVLSTVLLVGIAVQTMRDFDSLVGERSARQSK